MNKKNIAGLILISFTLAGCSDRDPTPATPSYHVGTPTNRSSVQSWQINNEPFHTQPGVNPGLGVKTPLPDGTVSRGYEPYDSVAESVYNALLTGGTIDTKYVAANAKNGSVILIGSVPTAEQKQKAEQIARHVPGVLTVQNELTVVAEQK